MRFKSFICVFAFGFSFVFSLIYVFAFHYNIPNNEKQEELTLYMNQIGLYKEEVNALKIKKQLAQKDVKTYIYENEDLYVVVSGIGDKEAAEANGKKLKKLSYSHILKQYEIKDSKIIAYVEAKKFQKVLELIGNQSQRNAK